MPGNQMRSILRGLRVFDLGLPVHQLGQPYGTAQPRPSGEPPVDLEAVERSQWEAQARAAKQVQQERAQTPYHEMSRPQLAKECKRLGIKMARTDKKEALLEKLNGKQNAA